VFFAAFKVIEFVYCPLIRMHQVGIRNKYHETSKVSQKKRQKLDKSTKVTFLGFGIGDD
jgi:hypothetical protein